MRYVNFILFGGLLAAFIGGKARNSILTPYSDLAGFQTSAKETTNLKIQKNVLIVKTPLVQLRHKKYKTKGVEVTVPFISNRPFIRIPIQHEALPLYFSERFASFLFCVDRKRGPPELS